MVGNRFTLVPGATLVAGAAPVRVLDKEELIGLRARLAIMEVPAELDNQWRGEWGFGAHDAVEALKAQLQVPARGNGKGGGGVGGGRQACWYKGYRVSALVIDFRHDRSSRGALFGVDELRLGARGPSDLGGISSRRVCT